MLHSLLSRAFSFSLLLLTAAGCWGKDYQFTRITFGGPAGNLYALAILGINRSGTIAYNSNLGSFLYADGQIRPVTDPTGQYTVTPVALNDKGNLLVVAQRGSGANELAVLSGAAVTPIYNLSANVSRLNDITGFAFNNADQAALGGSFLNGTQGVLTVDTRPPVTVVSNTDPLIQLYGLALNDHGTVVFGRYGVLASTPSSLISGNGGPLTTVVSDDGPLTLGAFNTYPAINETGVIAFFARDDASQRRGVYVHQNGQTRLAVSGAAYESLAGLTINNGGELAFHATATALRSRGIFTGPDPVADAVIKGGDSLFGSTVALIGLGATGQITNQVYFNDRGQVVFDYMLANGEYGLAVATPVQAAGPPPVLTSGSVLNAASFARAGEADHAIAPGSIVSVFGTNFAPGLEMAGGAPLPTSLNGVSVTVNGSPAPLFFVAPNQINALLPTDLTAASALVAVSTPNGTSAAQQVQLASQSPAIYTLDQSGSGQAIVTFANSATLAAPAGATPDSRPAKAGDVLTIYANGLGAVTPPIASGHNSCDPVSVCAPDYSNLTLRTPLTRPRIEIGGVAVPDANISFAGLAPLYVGLFQINFTVPDGIAPGAAVPIVIRQGSAASRSTVTIALQ